MGGEAGESLRVGEHSRRAEAQNVSHIDADQRVQQSRIAADIRFFCRLIGCCGALQDPGKDLRPEGQGEDDAADGARRCSRP